MTWRRYLLVPRLLLTSLAAPRSPRRAWERYWSGVDRTGPGGQVLWDTDEPAEFERTAAHLREHADLSLPMVDLGCGSGRQAHALTALAPRVVGLDGAPAAVAHARRAWGSTVDLRVADIAEPGLGDRLAAELGDVNVHIRGVLHVLSDAQRRPVTETIAALLGRRGTLYLCETDQGGDPLDYLVAQGARPTHLPPAVHRLIRSGLRPPRHFGPAELAEFFPAPAWRVLAQGPATMFGVPVEPGGGPQRIPARFAVLRSAAGTP